MTGTRDTSTDLQRFLAGRDIPCPACAYNLRGLGSPRCPECGAPLSVEGIRKAIRAKGGAPVVIAGAGVLIFALIALPSAAFLMLMSAGVLLGSRVGEPGGSVAILLGLAATSLVLLLAPVWVARQWDRWEARIAEIPRARRWAIAALSWSWLPLLLAVLVLAPALIG